MASGDARGRIRERVRSLVELVALSGFAIAQPLLDVFGKAPEQFAFRGATATDIWVFALVVTFAPPLALWAIETAVSVAAPRAARALHLALIALLVVAFAMQAARALATGTVLVASSVIVGAVAVVAYARTKAARVWLAFAALAPIGFLGLFLVTSDTSRLFESADTVGIDGDAGDLPPVVVVVLDELPLVTVMDSSGEIDGELFPNLARLAGDSHWFRRTTAVATTTMHAVPSMLTGKLPAEGNSPIAADHPENLFTLLGGAYDLEVIEAVTRLCPADLCDAPDIAAGGLGGLLRDARTVFASRVSASGDQGDITAGLVEAVGDSGSQPSRGASDAAEAVRADSVANQPARLTAALDGLRSRDRTLHYLHLLLPHVPFRYLPDGTIYDEYSQQIGNRIDIWDAEDPSFAALARQRHVLQMMYTDALLGRMLDTLEERGLYDDVTFVLVADHGIAFTPGEEVRAGFHGRQVPPTTAAQVMYVPFFVKLPGQTEGEVHDDNVWTVDVLPTIADVLDIEVPWPVDGVSAFEQGARDAGSTSLYVNKFSRAGGFTLGVKQEADARELWPVALGLTLDHAFPPGDELRLWRVGPRPELVGLSVDDPRVRGAPTVEFGFDPGIDLDVAADETRPPILVRAVLEGRQPGDPVAVVLNDVVVATASVGADQSIVFLVDRARYVEGSNRFELRAL